MIISDRIPGQETGNVRLVTENKAGVYLPKPEKVDERIREWLAEDPETLRQRAANARKIARPDAVWEIAEAVWDRANRPKFARSRAS